MTSKFCILIHSLGEIPVVPLNYSVLSKEGPYSRDSVELCIKEIILAMSRCLCVKKSIQMDFFNVGRLLIQDSQVKFKFFRNFIKQLDFNGELENVFRPCTTQSSLSIMTNPSDSFLPRYVCRGGISGN